MAINKTALEVFDENFKTSMLTHNLSSLDNYYATKLNNNDPYDDYYYNTPSITTSAAANSSIKSSIFDESERKFNQISDRLLAIEKKLDLVFRDKSWEEEFPNVRNLYEEYEKQSKKLFDRYLREIEKAKTFKAMKQNNGKV